MEGKLGQPTFQQMPKERVPMVSIMVPCYNEGDNLDEAIPYLLQLRYPNYELIFINDGSKDNTGEIIDAAISQRLVETIFFKNCPLHDGAMVVGKGRVKAAACILPVSHNTNIQKNLGLRHRSGLGISQKTDCLAIIVSEETGSISIAHKGELKLRLTSEELEERLAHAVELW